MNENLRPSTLGEILDRTVQLYRGNFWLFAGVASLPIGTMIALGAAAGAFGAAVAVAMRNAGSSDVIVGVAVILIALVAVPLYFAAYVFSTAGLTQAPASTHRGEKLTIRATLASVRPHFWRYLAYLLLQGLIVAVIPAAAAGGLIGIPIFFAAGAGGGAAAGATTGLLMILVIPVTVVVIVWLALSYAMGMAVCVMEQKTAWESLKRALKLSQGTRGRIFVLFLLVIALSFVVVMIAYVPFIVVVGVSTAANNGTQSATALVIAEIVNVVLNFTLQTVLAPVSWIALVLFYYDQRVRKEGFDIEWMMQQAGLVSAQAASGPAPLATATPAAGSGVISGPALGPDTVEER